MNTRVDPSLLLWACLSLAGFALLFVLAYGFVSPVHQSGVPAPAIALPETATTASPEETREILEVVLRRRWGGVYPMNADASNPGLILVNRSVCLAASDAMGCESATRIIDRIGGLGEHIPRKLREGLVSLNIDPAPLDVKITGTTLARFEEIEAIFADGPGSDSWGRFQAAYPGVSGFVRISKPVISRDRREALIFASHNCGGTCGSGYLFHLTRSPSGWDVRLDEMLWIN